MMDLKLFSLGGILPIPIQECLVPFIHDKAVGSVGWMDHPKRSTLIDSAGRRGTGLKIRELG